MSEQDKYDAEAVELVDQWRMGGTPVDTRLMRLIAHKLRAQGEKYGVELRAEIERLKAVATCGCGDGFTVDDPGQCGNCSVVQRIEIERLTHEWQLAKDAVAHLGQGRPLGELVGKQTIVNMATEIAQLKAQLADWQESHQRIMAEDCPSDQKHCTCVSSLRTALAEATEKSDTYKRIAERNHKANLMPCPKCGYKPAIISAAVGEVKP